MTHTSKPIIIGAGPAGLSCAIQLAKFGVHTTLIDEQKKIGGAIFKQPEKGLDSSPYRNEKTYIKAKKLFDEFERYRSYIDLQLETEVVGEFPLANELVMVQKEKITFVSNTPLIIATGCYERVQPFPGWTLPGIMSVGGIQLQAKCGSVRPGKRVVLAGTGPLLLVAAKQLHMAGVQVVAVVEAGVKSALIKNISNLFSNLKVLQEGFAYLSYLKRHRIPIYYGHGIVKAEGDETLQKITIAPYTKEWTPIIEKSITLHADCAGIGYGYIPRTQLTQMLKCEHLFDPSIGGFYPKVDDWQRTSRAGIYAAGDSAGVYGAEVAMWQGKIAALAFLMDTYQMPSEQAIDLARTYNRKLQKLKKFQSAFYEFSALRKGLLSLPEKDTLICRCEHVKRKDIDTAIANGVTDMMGLKMNTRIGMGDCQGKMCGSFCGEYLANALDCSRTEVGTLRPRFPLIPIPFETITEKKLIYEAD